MKQRKKRQHRPPGVQPDPPAQHAEDRPGRRLHVAGRLVMGPVRSFLGSDVGRLFRRFHFAAAIWSVFAVVVGARFLWQRHYPVAGLWVSTSDLVVGGKDSVDTVRMAFAWQLVCTYVLLFLFLPIGLVAAGRRVASQIARASERFGVRQLGVAYVIIWCGFVLVLSSCMLPIGARLDGWVAAPPLVQVGLSWPLWPDARLVWLIGTCLAGGAYQLAVCGLLIRMWRLPRPERDSAFGDGPGRVVQTTLVVAGVVIPMLMAALLYWASGNWGLGIANLAN